MKAKELLAIIKKRRSVREFKEKEVLPSQLSQALEAGRWAPSGLNNQPWRFMILDSGEKDTLTKYTKYAQVVKGANKLILVFLDKESSYSYSKDLMAIGAFIQNILLYLEAQDLGACWLGEILNKAREVENKLNIAPHLEFVAAIAIGVPQNKPPIRERKTLDQLLLK